ncbi:MAG: AMP-binding protein [Phenylobacterium sp.]|nr:AMP-binding protein [Phenylobacterium sp.]
MLRAPLFSDVIRAQAVERPDRVAATCNGADLTYGELDARANQVAQGLIAAGCQPDARVGILSKNANAYIEILGGTLKARAVLLALNWRLAASELRYILDHGEAQVLFVEAEFRELADQAADVLRPPGRIIVIGAEDGYEAWRDAQPDEDPHLGGDPSDIFVQMYTSGTTGLPKGVQLTHANYAASFAAMDSLEWNRSGPEDTLFAPAPFFHVNGLNGILRSLQSGSRLLTVDQFRPADVVALFESERVTRGGMAPAMVQMCLEVPGIETRDFSALRLMIYGGSPISETVMKKAGALFGCDFAQGYGMTETSGPLTMLTPDDHRDDGRLLACGRPLPGIDVKVVRPDGTSCEPREVGEVVARGPMLTPGYWKDPKATAETVRDGWLHTGDAGYFDADGYLHIHDRVKEMIVSGGENVYPAEVENALAKDPDIADCAVIGVPDEKWARRSRRSSCCGPAPPRTKPRSSPGSGAISRGTRRPRASISSTPFPATPPARSSAATCESPIGPTGRAR